jgi:hypothetical protein
MAQTITVTGVDDFVDDGNIVYSIFTEAAASTDPNYNNLDVDDVSVTNTDDDTAGITVSAISGNTTEAGGTTAFSSVLNLPTMTDLVGGLSSSVPIGRTISAPSVIFEGINWNTALNDIISDENDDVATSAIVAEGAAGITVDLTSGLTTAEADGTVTFKMVLNARPTADVTIEMNSSDAAEETRSATRVTFTADNWYIAQDITIIGLDDSEVDDSVRYRVIMAEITSDDPNYNDLSAEDVSVINIDDDNSEDTLLQRLIVPIIIRSPIAMTFILSMAAAGMTPTSGVIAGAIKKIINKVR